MAINVYYVTETLTKVNVCIMKKRKLKQWSNDITVMMMMKKYMCMAIMKWSINEMKQMKCICSYKRNGMKLCS